jgi:hypothetical protein
MRTALRAAVLLILLTPGARSNAPSPAPAAGGIAWQTSWDKTFERAAAEKKLVFLAVNMDGERANDRIVEKVYRDKHVQEMAGRTLNLVASAAEHAGIDKPCPRFDGVRCQDHRRVDTAARKDVLKADAQGLVVAPQHVFLAPDGKIVLSVPYEIDAGELVWCFVSALQKLDAASAPAMPASARMPKRVIVGATHDPAGEGQGGSLVPPTSKEVQEILTMLKKGGMGEERMAALRRLVLSDDPDAVAYIGQELKSGGYGFGGGGGAGGGGGKGGGGAGAGGGGRGAGGDQRHLLILRAIGQLSPPPYWEMVSEFLDHDDEGLRREAAVAIEQLAAREAVPALTKALNAEKEPGHQKDLLRALGACGAGDSKTRALLVKRAKSDKQSLVRANAYLALAWSASDPDVQALLRATLEKGDDLDRAAAALAVGIARDAAWIPVLETAAAAAKDDGTKAAIRAARGVLDGAALSTLREQVVRVCRDEVGRERIFGREPKAAGR